MSVHVNEFLRKKGKNDLQYIELLITGKAVAKIRELEKEKAEIRAKAIEEFAERIRDWQKEIYQNGKYAGELDFLFKHINEIAEEMKGE